MTTTKTTSFMFFCKTLLPLNHIPYFFLIYSLHVCIDSFYFKSFVEREKSFVFFYKKMLNKDRRDTLKGGVCKTCLQHWTGTNKHNNTIHFKGNGLIWRQRQKKKQKTKKHHTNIDQKEHSHWATHCYGRKKKREP